MNICLKEAVYEQIVCRVWN